MAIEHPYKLRSIVIKDFKSIQQADIRLHPLSVLVGANSSGKSSLLQAILAISQATRSRSAGTAFPLNGEYARFGTFSETVRFRLPNEAVIDASERRIQFGFTISNQGDFLSFDREKLESDESDSTSVLMDWLLILRAAEIADSGMARIDSVSLKCYQSLPDSESRVLLHYDLHDVRDLLAGDPDHGRQILSPMGRVRSRATDITRTAGIVRERDDNGDLVSAERDAVELRGAIPEALYERSTFVEAIGRHWWNVAKQLLPASRSDGSEEKLKTKRERAIAVASMVESAAKAARVAHEALVEGGEGRRRTLPIAFQMHYILNEQFEEDSGGSIRQNLEFGLETLALEEFLGELSDALSANDWSSEQVWNSPDDPYSPPVSGSPFAIDDLFAGSVKYLGPLRKAPQVLYDPRLRDLDLGLSGEYTAAILHANSDHQVVPISDSEVDRVNLGSEVDNWLHAFGLATRALLSDRGRLGIGLRITPIAGQQPVDVTSVGVGLSQILPVIVLCLLAEPGDLIILEQPELHLHPALQQQLGDFLLDCANSGRQLLVETHSEHLVNRLRRRVADPSGADEEMVGLIFAEQHDGVTSFRQSIVNAYGGTEPDWPEGFFDVSAREAQALVSASLTKRYRDSTPE